MNLRQKCYFYTNLKYWGEKLTKYGLIRNLNDCDLYSRLLEYLFNYLIKLNISIRYVLLVFNVIFKVFQFVVKMEIPGIYYCYSFI